MKNGKELRMGKKYEATSVERKRILTVHNVDREDVGIYECVCDGDTMSVQLALKGETSHFSYWPSFILWFYSLYLYFKPNVERL